MEEKLTHNFMKFIKVTLFAFLLLSSINLTAQVGEGKANRGGNSSLITNNETFNRSTGSSGTGSNIDVIYHKIFWRLNPDTSIGKYIKGSVQFNFKTTQANVSVITFDLRRDRKAHV